MKQFSIVYLYGTVLHHYMFCAIFTLYSFTTIVQLFQDVLFI